MKKANRPRQTRNEAIILPMQSMQFVTVTTLLERSVTHLSEKRKRVIRIRQWNYYSWNVSSYAYFAVTLSTIFGMLRRSQSKIHFLLTWVSGPPPLFPQKRLILRLFFMDFFRNNFTLTHSGIAS